MNKFGIHSRPAIDDICSDIEAMDRSVLHDKIVFALAVDKTEAPKPSFLKLEFLAKDQVIPDSVEYDYGYYLLLRKSIFYEDFRDILLKIRDEEAIGIFPIENCVLKIDGWDKRWIPSNQQWGFVQPEFPTLYYQGSFNQQISGRVLQDNLAGNNYPPYPTADKAIAHLFDLRANFQFTQPLLLIVVPDLRARIRKVRIAGKMIRAEINARGVPRKELRLQLYISGNKLVRTESSLALKEDFLDYPFEEEPEHILVLLTTREGEILDKKEISMRYRSPDRDVIVETPAYSLQEIISSGEGKHVEFKSRLDNPEPFVSSVAAFGNTEGGRIFIGVDDHGEAVGVKEPNNVKGKIMEWIAQYCDPRIDVKINYSEELDVVIVEVPLGGERPYFLKTGGCFIRHGATDRQATRVELEQMQKATRKDR